MTYFAEWRKIPAAFAEIATFMPYDIQLLAGSTDALCQRGPLTDKDAEAELAKVAQKLGPTLGAIPPNFSTAIAAN